MKLYQHQIEALEQTKEFNRVAYYLDMGLGKTYVGSEKMNQIDSKVNLIICQKSKINDWYEHVWKNYNYTIFDLTDKHDFELFFEHVWLNESVVGIINYELAFRRPDLLKLSEFTLMLDESSLIQNRKAKQTKFILKLKPDNVILLSGTPSSGKYENLWTQAHLLGWDIKESTYMTHYVNYDLIDVGGFKHKVVSKTKPYKNVERLKDKFREYGSVFMKTEEVFDLPQQNFIDVTIPASKDYNKFMKNKIITIDDTELVGDTSLTKLLYARQLCSIYSQDKLNAFKDLVNSTKDRLIVFYNFNDELDALISSIDRPYSLVNGSVKDLSNYENENDSVTFIQYQAGAMGLNLQKANKIVYYSLPLRSELFEQSKKRIHRIGQDKPCFYYTMICKGTVEEQIQETLNMRRDFNDELFKEHD